MSKPTYRKMWMFPRNIRRIEAWKMVQISQLLDACTGVMTDQLVQENLYKQLSELGLKCETNPNGVANPGGMRTYFAQLACLGLFWKDKDKNFHTTFAGEELINAKDPQRILRCQILRMQYPSVYGLGSQVRIDPKLQVKPGVFIIKLLQDERLGGFLTCKEMAVAVVYGHTPKCHNLCIQKILKLRETDQFSDIVDSVDDLRTPKRYNENNPQEDLEKGIVDAINIGNTFKNYLQATKLILQDLENSDRFVLNQDAEVENDINLWINEKIEPLDPSHQQSWQMRFGRYTKTKSLRTVSSQRTNGAKALVCSNFINAVENSPYEFDLQAFIKNEANRWGISQAEVGKFISHVRSHTHSIERETIKNASISGGKDAIVFEKAVATIFRKLGFDLTEHIGQKKAPRPGGYPDIRIRSSLINTCGFGDTKATVKYDFPIGDANKLNSYYTDCWKEFEDKTPASYFLYIAGGFLKKVSTIEGNLKVFSNRFRGPVSAMTVDALLDLIEMNNPPTPQCLVKAFEKGAYYTTGESIVNAISTRQKV